VDLNFDEEIRKAKERKDGCFYAQIPVKLLDDRRVSPGAKICYGRLHSYCKNKDITSGKSQTFISQSRLARDLGLKVLTIKRWGKELRETGWISIKRRKGTRSNIITLNPYPKKSERINRWSSIKNDTTRVILQ